MFLGSGTEDDQGGGAVVFITSNMFKNEGEINCTSDYGTGGTIFICCKSFVNTGSILATGYSLGKGDGRIAIYTDKYDPENIGTIDPKAYWGTYRKYTF